MALPTFATVPALAEWLGEDIEDDSADWKRAERCLRAASNRIRRYTKRTWVDEAGLYLTASEMQTLDDLVADQSPLIGGLGVISTTRGEHASQDMSPYWSEDDGRPGFLHARLTG